MLSNMSILKHPKLRRNTSQSVNVETNVLVNANVRVYISDGKVWRKIGAGLVSIECKPDGAMVLRVHDSNSGCRIYDSRLFYEMNYTEACPQFHYFFGEENTTGLAFEKLDEATAFSAIVQTALSQKNYTKMKHIPQVNKEKLKEVGRKARDIFRPNKNRANEVSFDLNTWQHVQSVRMDASSRMTLVAKDESAAIQLLEYLGLSKELSSKEDVQHVMNMVNEYGVDNVLGALDRRRIAGEYEILSITGGEMPPNDISSTKTSSHSVPPKPTSINIPTPAIPVIQPQSAPPIFPPSSSNAPPHTPPPPLFSPVSTIQTSPPPQATNLSENCVLDDIVNFNKSGLKPVCTPPDHVQNEPQFEGDVIDLMLNSIYEKLQKRRSHLACDSEDDDEWS